ncbi:MAG: methyltransferase domain-containing protein [Planctomycetaceae bacterium]
MANASAETFHYAYRTNDAAHTSAYLWPEVLRQLDQSGSRRVLDAGCGNGAFSRVLAARGHEVTGVDLSESGIDIARDQCPACRFEIASVTDDLLARFQEPFDAVVSLEVVEHLYDPRLFARRMFDSVRPGGRLIVSTPYHGYLKNLALAASGKLDAHFTALWDGGHIKFWSRRSLTQLLVEVGFHPVSFAGAGRLPYIWKSMILTVERPA